MRQIHMYRNRLGTKCVILGGTKICMFGAFFLVSLLKCVENNHTHKHTDHAG